MPELAEVEYYRRQWDPGLGHRVRRVTLHARKRVFRGTDSAALRRCLTGQTFIRSEARGKRMRFIFSGHNSLGVHLGMTGKLSVEERRFRPQRHDHLVLYQAKRALVLRDSRQFGRVLFHHGKAKPPWWKEGVPEIVSPRFTRRFVDDFLQRHRKAPIKAALLLQDGFSGIGNWMADEILWRAGILPRTAAGRLSAKKRALLRKETRFVARISLRVIGCDFSDPPKSWLIHQRWKKDGVCPRHGTPLRRATIGGRTTAWCPGCQH
jgi:formamidopyrimidine-DNA glycosylase